MTYLAKTGKNKDLYHHDFLSNDIDEIIEHIKFAFNTNITEYFECGLDEDFAFENSQDYIDCIAFNCKTDDNFIYYLRLYEDGSFNVKKLES